MEIAELEAVEAAAGAVATPPAVEQRHAAAGAAEFERARAKPIEFDIEPEGAESHEFEPGLQDLEAAVALVSAGLAKRVVLSGFQSWPGLLWRAYQLAESAGVVILPTVVRPGGRVDIVITRETSLHG